MTAKEFIQLQADQALHETEFFSLDEDGMTANPDRRKDFEQAKERFALCTYIYRLLDREENTPALEEQERFANLIRAIASNSVRITLQEIDGKLLCSVFDTVIRMARATAKFEWDGNRARLLDFRLLE